MIDDFIFLETKIQVAIVEKFGIGLPHMDNPTVKYADLSVLHTERHELLGRSPFPWDCDSVKAELFSARIDPFSSLAAEAIFLDRYCQINEMR